MFQISVKKTNCWQKIPQTLLSEERDEEKICVPKNCHVGSDIDLIAAKQRQIKIESYKFLYDDKRQNIRIMCANATSRTN